MGSIWLFNSPCGLYVFVRFFSCFFRACMGSRGNCHESFCSLTNLTIPTGFFCWLGPSLLCFLLLRWAYPQVPAWYHHDWPRKFGPLLQIFRAPSADLMGLKCVANDSWPSNLFGECFQYHPKMVKLVNGFWCLALLHQLQAKETCHMLLLVPRYLNWHMIYD